MAQGWAALAVGRIVGLILIQPAHVLLVVAIDTQQFPVAAVGRIVIVIVIPMMNRQFPQLFPFKFARTTATHMGEKF